MNCDCDVENDGVHSCRNEQEDMVYEEEEKVPYDTSGYVEGEELEVLEADNSLEFAHFFLSILATTFDKVKPERRMAIKKRAAELLLEYLESLELVTIDEYEE